MKAGGNANFSSSRKVTTRVSGSRNGDEFAKEGGREGGGRESNRILCLHCLSAQLRQPRGPLAANTTGLDSVLLGSENCFTTLGDGVNRPYLMYSISCDKQANNQHLSLVLLTSRSRSWGLWENQSLGDTWPFVTRALSRLLVESSFAVCGSFSYVQ